MTPSNMAHKFQDIELFQPSMLFQGQLTAVITQVWPTSGTTATPSVLRKLLAVNTDASARTLTVRLNQAAGAGAAAGNIVSAESIPANSRLYIDFGANGLVLPTGSAISAGASSASVVNLLLSGGVSYSA